MNCVPNIKPKFHMKYDKFHQHAMFLDTLTSHILHQFWTTRKFTTYWQLQLQWHTLGGAWTEGTCTKL